MSPVIGPATHCHRWRSSAWPGIGVGKAGGFESINEGDHARPMVAEFELALGTPGPAFPYLNQLLE
jgi:hypothetical protein